MISVSIITIVLFIILDFFVFYWIYKTRDSINKIKATESTLCPVYFCDFYENPITSELEPGSYCYSKIPGKGDRMVAYRYNDGEYECQELMISDNIPLS